MNTTAQICLFLCKSVFSAPLVCPARRPAGGATPATSERAHALLSQGHSLCIHVGGIAEMFEGHDAKEVVHLSRRRGFLRFALCHGVPVVPMYHFGGSQIFSFWPRCAALESLSAAL